MDTAKIKAFLKASEYGSFSKVAEELNYTPSALSHMCDSLEEELGVKLFVRSYSGVKLTDAGQELYDDFKRFVDLENKITFKAKSLFKKQKEVRIGVYSSIASTVLPNILKELKNNIPDIKVSINVFSQELSQEMKNNTVDIVLSSDDYGFDYEWLPLFFDPYYIAVPDSVCFKSKVVAKDDIYNFTLIKTEKSIIAKNFDEKRFKDIIDVKTEDFSLALNMVKEGVGVSLVPEIAVPKTFKGVRFYKIYPEIKRTLGVYCKKDVLKRKEIKVLVDGLKSSIKK